LETRIYQSTKNYTIATVLKESANGFKESFYLAKQLAKRDINAQYRQSVLGVFWAFVPVLMSASVWIFLNGTGTIRMAETNIPYPLFVVIGTTLWSVFGDCLLMTISSVNANKSIITKINFQKEALITLGFIKLSFNLLIKLGLILVLMLFYKVSISASVIWFLPILLMAMLAFISVGVLLTPIGILYHDVNRLIPVLMQVMMYLTPVVYNVPKDGLMKTIMQYNPLTYILNNLRNSLTGYDMQHTMILLGFTIITLFIFLLAILIYRISMPIITERMSA